MIEGYKSKEIMVLSSKQRAIRNRVEILLAASSCIFATVLSPAIPQRNFSRMILPQLYLLLR